MNAALCEICASAAPFTHTYLRIVDTADDGWHEDEWADMTHVARVCPRCRDSILQFTPEVVRAIREAIS